VVYAVFGWLLSRSFGALVPNRRRVVFLVLLLGTAYAASDELHQKFVPGRCADGFDFLADAFGLALSQTAVYIKKKQA
jgi:VanZ family protein